MSDLISRKPLVDMLQGVEDNIFAEAMREVNPNKAFVAGVVQEVKNQVLALPGVDAVPVVRCRNCRLWRRTEAHYGKCPFLIGENQYTSEDGFCNLGEKKVAESE